MADDHMEGLTPGNTGSRAIGTRWCKRNIKFSALRIAAVLRDEKPARTDPKYPYDIRERIGKCW
jgi:hypothetical protein